MLQPFDYRSAEEHFSDCANFSFSIASESRMIDGGNDCVRLTLLGWVALTKSTAR